MATATSVLSHTYRADEAMPVILDGFFREDLATLFGELQFKKGAEIGVAEGKFSRTLCEAIPGLALWCVDPWAPYPGNPQSRKEARQNECYVLAQQALQPYDVMFIRAKSADAAPQVALDSLDFVYIDGHHGLEYVRQDLALWDARVRAGGIIAGHDYYPFRRGGVIQAVNEFVEAHAIRPWFLTDSKWRRPSSPESEAYLMEMTGHNRYREASFFWVKP